MTKEHATAMAYLTTEAIMLLVQSEDRKSNKRTKRFVRRKFTVNRLTLLCNFPVSIKETDRGVQRVEHGTNSEDLPNAFRDQGEKNDHWFHICAGPGEAENTNQSFSEAEADH